jgi:hypothetical protein
MTGLTITNKPTISLSLTANDWELYSPLPGAAQAARELNRALEEAVNSGLDRVQTFTAVWPVFQEHTMIGATDSEPMWHLDRVLDAVFGKRENDEQKLRAASRAIPAGARPRLRSRPGWLEGRRQSGADSTPSPCRSYTRTARPQRACATITSWPWTP